MLRLLGSEFSHLCGSSVLEIVKGWGLVNWLVVIRCIGREGGRGFTSSDIMLLEAFWVQAALWLITFPTRVPPILAIYDLL